MSMRRSTWLATLPALAALLLICALASGQGWVPSHGSGSGGSTAGGMTTAGNLTELPPMDLTIHEQDQVHGMTGDAGANAPRLLGPLPQLLVIQPFGSNPGVDR